MIKYLMIFLITILILTVGINFSNDFFKRPATAQSLLNKTFVLITNTSVYTCSSSSSSISNYSNSMNNNNDSNFIWNYSYKGGIVVKFGNPNNSKIHNVCPFSNISF